MSRSNKNSFGNPWLATGTQQQSTEYRLKTSKGTCQAGEASMQIASRACCLIKAGHMSWLIASRISRLYGGEWCACLEKSL
eukprot:1142802-Pelagomonas_calceolata.AAC.6